MAKVRVNEREGAAAQSAARPATEQSTAASVLRLKGVSKTYGRTQALRDASLEIRRGEMIGVAGHNGAGKTTLMKIIGGLVARDAGSIAIGGADLPEQFSVRQARRHGIALAMQEISLFPDLRVVEHVAAVEPARMGLGWRVRGARRLAAQLDAMFPSHGIAPAVPVESLSLAQRQMLQIALATLTDEPAKLLILDEPTSSLTDDLAEQLFTYLHRECQESGLSVVLVSHKMTDILGHTERTLVMRDGAMVSDRGTSEITLDEVMADMGAAPAETAAHEAARSRVQVDRSEKPAVVEVRGLDWHGLHSVDLHVQPGEIVGLAGLEANGQQQVLEAVWQARRRLRSPRIARAVIVRGRAAYISGDRQEEGLFPLWSVQRNISIGALDRVGMAGLVSPRRERSESDRWISTLSIKAAPEMKVTALSGGSQQKVLLARGLAQQPNLLILDDPFRGVDVTTKVDAYRRLREFARQGAAILWYTSENSELLECDRVYVLRDRQISAELIGDDLTAEHLIATSFGERPLLPPRPEMETSSDHR